MNILLFEWLNSGGLRGERFQASPGQRSMLEQGRQMLSTVLEDFMLEGHEVTLPLDGRLWDLFPSRGGLEKRKVLRNADLSCLLKQLADEADFILVIAPETDSILVECLNGLSSVKHKLLNPTVEFTSLTSNKNLMFEYLKQEGFKKNPHGASYEEYLDDVDSFAAWPLPLVFKPADGAGGDEVNIVRNWEDCSSRWSRHPSAYRVEEFVGGTPVSVSVICGPDGCDLLAPTIQVFDPHAKQEMHYLEAKYPIERSLTQRALNLAREVINVLPQTQGYFGIDMVLGEENGGHGEPQDWLIEVNPRLTTSYLKLREIYTENLAGRMLQKAIGKLKSQSGNQPANHCSFLKPSL